MLSFYQSSSCVVDIGIAVVNVCSLLFCADEYYMMESVFDIPAGDLYARLVDSFDEKVMKICTLNVLAAYN